MGIRLILFYCSLECLLGRLTGNWRLMDSNTRPLTTRPETCWLSLIAWDYVLYKVEIIPKEVSWEVTWRYWLTLGTIFWSWSESLISPYRLKTTTKHSDSSLRFKPGQRRGMYFKQCTRLLLLRKALKCLIDQAIKKLLLPLLSSSQALSPFNKRLLRPHPSQKRSLMKSQW